jgi:hypothetical protein
MSDAFELIRSRRRTIALIVETDGRLVVRAPMRAPAKFIREFVESKAAWIRRKQAEMRSARLPDRRYTDGEHFFYLGKSYTLTLVGPQRPALQLDSGFRLARAAQSRARAAFVRWYKGRAESEITARVRQYAEKYGFRYERVRITSAHARWGSCSSKGTLSFTYRLVMAPPAVIDYVVVHELVHLQVKNHSRAFWSRVGDLMPDYKVRVAWLRKNGRLLTLETG